MKHSLSYYITFWVLKLKGIKKNFSQDPIDYKKLRKEDVKEPKGNSLNKYITRKFEVSNSTITEIAKNKSPERLLLFIHGGAFISGPAAHHWATLKEIILKTNYTVWMCDYPKAPEIGIKEISRNIDAVYMAALDHFESISVMGDSVGGTLAAALTQRLIKNGTETPDKVFLISPVMDASMTNTAIKEIDPKDPMLSLKGVLSAKKMCAQDLELKNEMISPLYGSFKGFPKTAMWIGEYDITYPDQLLAAEKLKSAKVELAVFKGENMPHIWPLLPVMKEAKEGLSQIINQLNA